VYGKVFDQIYKSTVAECWQALVTFQQFIVLADSDGIVDMTPSSISRTTNIPIEIIEEGIAKLEEKDPQSRSPLEDGRRIIRLDEHRDWGWKLVNHAYYMGLRTREDKKEADRIRIAEKRKKGKENIRVADCRPESQPVAEVAHTDTEALRSSSKEKQVKESFPEWWPTEAWEAFVESRKKLRKPLTAVAIKRLVNKLTEANAEAALWASVENGWSGVFPEKADEASKRSGKSLSAPDRVRKACGLPLAGKSS